MFSLSNAIKIMIVGGLLAVMLVGVKACQKPPTALDRFGTDSLKKLTSLDLPPTQPGRAFATPAGEISLTDYRGKVVLVNAWATWCPPCVAEMPSLEALQELRGGDDFAVVPISLDRVMSDAVTFYERNDLTALPLVHDASFAINSELQLPGLPTSVIYDRNGRELARLPGEAEWDSEEALALIDYLIAQ